MTDLRPYLHTILKQIAEDASARSGAPVPQLLSDSEDEAGMSGILDISVLTEAGSLASIYQETFSGLRTRTEVDDLLARGLSTALMLHRQWPR